MVGASRRGGATRLPPHRMGLEDLPGPFPLIIVPLVIGLGTAPVSGCRGHGFADLPRTLRGVDARHRPPGSPESPRSARRR